MDSGDLTAEQLDALRKKVDPGRRFLESLKRRMDEQRFPHGDKLRQCVVSACDAVHRLWVALHYITCDRLANREPQRCHGSSEYRIDVAVDHHKPLPRFDDLETVEAETPLEAIAKLGQYGRLSNIVSPVVVRVVLEADRDGKATKVLTLEIDRDLVTSYVPTAKSK